MLSPVEQIKERLSIIDVVSSYVKLEKSGLNYKARCPFHNERTPSFVISPNRNSYHCFGCNRGGDIFSFIQEIEGLEFAPALKLLADRAGILLQKIDPQKQNERTKLYELLDEATKFFEVHLYKNEAVKDYLKGRGLEEATVRSFRLGFAPDEWSALATYLNKKGYPNELIEKAGLTGKGTRGYYDRFRSRIMFPIADSQGRIVGYSGRIFSALGSDPADTAKYVNSPETVLYNKSEILFGYDKAKQSLMRANACIVVEGQMDLLMAHQAGTTNTIAVSGTALTEEHLKLIKRFTDNVLLCFDGDNAGFKAAERSVSTALNLGMEVKIISLPNKLDPADLILKDKTAWESACKESRHIIDVLLDKIASEETDTRILRREAGKHILPYIASIGSSIDQAHFIKVVAERIGIDEAAIREELTKIKIPEQSRPSEEIQKPKTFRSMVEDRLLGIIFWQDLAEAPVLQSRELKDRFEKISGQDFKVIDESFPDAKKQDLILQAEMYHQGQDVTHVCEELFINFEQEYLESELARLMNELKAREIRGDTEGAHLLLTLCQDVSRRLHDVKNNRLNR